MLKEIAEPAGAVIRAQAFILGDPTLSVLEVWGAEYQESSAVLVKPEHKGLLQGICEREKVAACFVGTITGKLSMPRLLLLYRMFLYTVVVTKGQLLFSLI